MLDNSIPTDIQDQAGLRTIYDLFLVQASIARFYSVTKIVSNTQVAGLLKRRSVYKPTKLSY